MCTGASFTLAQGWKTTLLLSTGFFSQDPTLLLGWSPRTGNNPPTHNQEVERGLSAILT